MQRLFKSRESYEVGDLVYLRVPSRPRRLTGVVVSTAPSPYDNHRQLVEVAYVHPKEEQIYKRHFHASDLFSEKE